jgi:hypothetical protein
MNRELGVWNLEFWYAFQIPKSKVLIALFICAAQMPAAYQEQTFSGRLSDGACGASHNAKAAHGALTDRQCLLACIRALAKYVLIDQNGHVIPIANQDAIGLPLYAGRPVRLTGERNADAIFVVKVEATPAHLHIGHVMTNWRDTPGGRGFLPVALDEARVALLHAGLAAKAAQLDEIKLHAGHVLHALDPAVESTGPGAGYGIKKAAAGAQQHLGFASTADGVTANVTIHAASVSSLLSNVLEWVNDAIAVAQRMRASTDAADAARLARDLEAVTRRISDEGLRNAQIHMDLMLKAEGLAGAPR